MRKFLILALIIIGCGFNSYAQLKFQGSVIQGPTSNSVDLVIRPTVAFTGYLTNVVFTIQIPSAVTQPTFAKTNLSPYFGSYTDIAAVDDIVGYKTYAFSATNTSNTTNVSINAGENYPVLRLTFNNGPTSMNTIRFANLAGGGSMTLHQFYVEANAVGPGANDYTNYVHMFFGPAIEPATPLADETIGYNTYQYASISVTLPVNWLSFDAVKQGNNALLTWKVSNEESNHHYELQRSLSGSDFATIAAINRNGTGNSTQVYEHTDPGIISLGRNIIHYRIKQVDADGRSSVSSTRIIRLNLKKGVIGVFPVPVKEGFYVSIPFENPGNKIVKLSLLSNTGQLAQSKDVTELQATNYYFDVSKLNLSSGQYQLLIYHDGQMLETRKLFVSK